MTTIRDRIKAALEQDERLTSAPIDADCRMSAAARELLPLVLAELDSVAAERYRLEHLATGLRAEWTGTSRALDECRADLARVTAERDEARTLLDECRAQNRAMAETMPGRAASRSSSASVKRRFPGGCKKSRGDSDGDHRLRDRGDAMKPTIEQLRAMLAGTIDMTSAGAQALFAALDVAEAAERYISYEDDGSVFEAPTRAFAAAIRPTEKT